MADQLLSSHILGDLPLKNRVVMAPLTRSRAGVERLPNDLMAEYYQQRAGAGLIITEATVISPQGIGWLNTPGIYTDAQMTAWAKIVAAVPTPMFVQLWHCGRASHPDFHAGALPVAPSALGISGDGIYTPQGKQPYVVPRALETAEIPLIVQDYYHAAKRAQSAGFAGIEIHGANGYLIDTFLQSKTNQRLDEYGGNAANRLRFLREIVEAVLTVFPAQRVGVRLSPNGVFNDMGSPDFRENFCYYAQELNQHHLGYLHIMDGLAFGFHGLGEAMQLKEFRLLFAGAIMGNCGYTQATAEQVIADGSADLIAFGRDWISNPDLVARFIHGWPLNPPAETQAWYSFGAEGYIDFPTYQERDSVPV
ncbi:xenobiotic reductase B [Gloeomargarita lithophora Alchichica-D10]|uniref:Xenobiotic reductase B n=1 Tax=Gloeomargarita lithophora Alchichica-D10 TaxID=1188229 RepID=A0A1J0AG21_9CYAN|nr:alkene reductase [Gloeomargarita lithophora]APB34886.1 xenobiotic reductase B [Gloeomargarita lithophora Alchichica-D10]